MKKILFITAFSILIIPKANANYINYYLLHVGIDNTLTEHKRQVNARNEQSQTTVAENINQSESKKFKEKYVKIKDRLNSLSLVIDAFFLSPSAIPAVKGIYDNQKRILKECGNNPLLIPIAIESEVQFIDNTQMIIRFVTGLVLTYGDVNQMKPSDRKMLLSHAIEEIDALWTLSQSILSAIENAKMAMLIKEAQWKVWKNQEKDLINDIIKNAKDL